MTLSSVLLAPEDACELEVRGAVPAAVLVPLYERGGELRVILTERHHDLPRHAGEISFPGGRREPEDADLSVTALREAHEEIGLPPERVKLIGALPPSPTMATGYAIYPFVGMIDPDQTFVADPREVADVIDLSLGEIAAGYQRRRLSRRGMPVRTDAYVAGDHVIWGATARILADLLDRIGHSTDAPVKR